MSEDKGPIRPGPRNLITDVDGLLVGQAGDSTVASGTSVVFAETGPAVLGVDVRGGAPGTRETDLANPACLVDAADAVVLSGGSAFGLAAADGVMGWLAEAGRGFAVGAAVVPIVPAAILYDLGVGDKPWARPGAGGEPPYRGWGRAAIAAAAKDFDLGKAGAGIGAQAGSQPGGIGSASAVTQDGLQVGAMVAANPVGEVLMPGGHSFWAWPLEQGDEFGGYAPPTHPVSLAPPLPKASATQAGANTTIAVVATNARLTKDHASRIAIMAQDGIARAVRPAHTPFDGDTVFALGTGLAPPPYAAPDWQAISLIGHLAADCLARAIARAVYAAMAG